MGRVFVAPISFGLGDLVVSLPAVQALVADARGRDDDVWLVARSTSQSLLAARIPGLAGCVTEDALVLGPDDRHLDLRDHPIQRDHWWGSAAFEDAFGALGINDILARICEDAGIHADFARPEPLTSQPRHDLAGTVLLVHETDAPNKMWPADRWARVASELRADAIDVRQVTRGDASPVMRGTGIPVVVAPTPGDAVDVLTGCRAVIGVDTGLTHIAVQQGTPTVTLCRQHGVYMRPWAHCRALRGGPCTDACAEAEARSAYHDRVSLRGFEPTPWRCPSGAPCLDDATPAQALALLRELL
jgi:hypothetical protein